MTYINIRQLSRLIQIYEPNKNLRDIIQNYHQKYSLSVVLEDFQSLIDIAQRLNKRQKSKGLKYSKPTTIAKAEIFVYGEFKIFCWCLIIYSLIKHIQLTQLKEKDFEFLRQIFKQKSIDFLQYQVKCLIFSKDKYIRQWQNEEIQLLQIINQQKTSQDWKSVSYNLYCRSQKKYFRPFQQCRQKWINQINPSIKKGDWTLEEDIQLFSLVSQLGCRWALISRQLKGARSEHSIKNRYNSVIKSMRKQYKITSNQEVQSKILKYLRFRLQRKSKNSQELNISSESKESRQRSRQIPLKLNGNSHELDNIPLEANLNDVFDAQNEQKEQEDQKIQENIIHPHIYTAQLEEEKSQKRTWEEQYEVIDGQISIMNCDQWSSRDLEIEDKKNEGEYNEFLDGKFMNSTEILPNEMREDIQSALGCGHYEKLMNDDWLFEGNWLDLDE